MVESRFVPGDLKPGDHLLYSRKGFVAWVIKKKTVSPFTHIEIYIGDGKTIAARAKGVHRYDLDLKDLSYVLRPIGSYDIYKMLNWFKAEADGQGYDYIGLYLSFWAQMWGRKNKKMFCSELALRADRSVDFEPFTPDFDADACHPGDFWKSSKFVHYKVRA